MSFLQKMFGPPNIQALAEKKNIPALVQALSYHKDAAVCNAAVTALSQIGEPAIQPILQFLDTAQDEESIQYACKALAGIGLPSVYPLLNQCIDEKTRDKAMRALTGMGALIVPELIDYLPKQTGAQKCRPWAAQVLGEIGAKLEDADLRGWIVDELVACAGVDFTTFGGNSTSSRPQDWPRSRSKAWSGVQGWQVEVDFFEALLLIGNVRALRWMAEAGFPVDVYRKLGNPEPVHELAERVFRGIANKAGRASIPVILDTLWSLDSNLGNLQSVRREDTKKVMYEVLRNLTGQTFEDKLDKWRTWWKTEEQQAAMPEPA